MWNPEGGKFFFVESRILGRLESTIPLKESGIPKTITIRNPISIDEDRNPVPGIRNLRRGIQNPRLSWIPLHWTKVSSRVKKKPQPLPGWSLIQVPLKKTGIQCLESRIQDCLGFPYIGRKSLSRVK